MDNYEDLQLDPTGSETIAESAAESETVGVSEARPETVKASEADPETFAGDSTSPEKAPEEDRYSRYAAADSVRWNGSSYNGRPAQDSVYRTDNPADNSSRSYQSGPVYGSDPRYGADPRYSADPRYGADPRYSADPRYGSGPQYGPYSGPVYGSGAPYGYYPQGNWQRPPYGGPSDAAGYVSSPKTKKAAKKHKMPKALKFILSGVAFGLLAAAVFIGANFLYYTINPDAAPISSGQSSDIHGAPVANTVGSTPLIQDVDTTPTDVSAVVESAMPSIVQINCTFNTTSWFGVYETSGAGSGIILKKTDTALLIATNNHVVENATSINVTFCDDSTVSAVCMGTDASADLAVVSVSLDDLPPKALLAVKVATLGDSNNVKVGQMAIAIGNSMGYGQSTTVGYISANEHEVDVDGKTMILLQTDAAINPGNSGGALLNLDGEVIGINSVKYASEDVEGMGFAIPISRAVDILNELSSREILSDEEKGYLGVMVQSVTSEVADAYGWPIGVYVGELIEGGAAEACGIRVGDIITSVNGVTVETGTDLRNSVSSYRVGTTVSITLQRLTEGAFEEVVLEVTLQVNPEYLTEG